MCVENYFENTGYIVYERTTKYEEEEFDGEMKRYFTYTLKHRPVLRHCRLLP